MVRGGVINIPECGGQLSCFNIQEGAGTAILGPVKDRESTALLGFLSLFLPQRKVSVLSAHSTAL